MTEPSQTAFRLSPQQSFLLTRPGDALVSQCVVALEPPADPAAVGERLRALSERHETLRTTFPTPAGARAPVAQAVHERLEPTWEIAQDSGDTTLETLLAREASRLDPERGPTIRALLSGSDDGLLVLTALSACADARSLTLMAAELSGRARQAALEPIQHADFAEWRHELRASEEAQAADGRAFWSALSEAGEPLRLLFGSAGPRGRSRARVGLDLGPDLLARLGQQADATRTPLERLLEAAWLALVVRLSGAGEVLAAGLAHGRSQSELDDAIGPYEQPVPIRVRVESQTRFAELLDRVGRARADGVLWQDYASEADLARLADVASAGFAAIDQPAGPVRSLSVGTTGAAIELAWLGGDRLELRYDEAIYDAHDAAEIAACLIRLLASVAEDASLVIESLRIVDGDRREALLALAAGPAPSGVPEPVHHEFERRAQVDGDLLAVVGDGQTLTYRELNERANQLAHRLRELGAGRDDAVALCLRRTPALLVGLLGIMKAGAAYLPLNFTHPPARLAHQLGEAGTRWLVTESELESRLPVFAGVQTLCLDRDDAGLTQRPVADPPRVSRPDDLAYVMYTSGSTGLPKGVAVTHGNLANYTAAISKQLGAGAGMQCAVVSEISTDLGNTAIYPALARGGCIHLIDPETAMDGAKLGAYAAEHPFDVIKITPTHLRALLAASDAFLPRRWLVLGGEALSWELADGVAAASGCQVLNHYGPTETTIGCCTHLVEAPEGRPPSATVPIGRAIAGARAYVLDGRLDPVPAGVVGELCVGGAGVARAYVNRPQETAERFVDDPRGGRMYRTGDRVRFHRDGTIEFLGRVDHQLKIRGYRVEPGEIEAALLRHPSVREAAVVAREEGQGDPRLVAYFVAVGEPELGDLQAFLADSLPEYMMPSRWVPISAFPLTPSGKIDRMALPDPDSVRTERRSEFVAPRDEVEREIATVWAGLLGVEQVGVLDDFFALGGHSLLATQAIMKIRRIYGNIPLGALFNSPTVAALAEVIRNRTTQE